MLKQVCVHQGKRHRFFVMEEQNVETFIKEVNKVRTDDLYVTGIVEDFDLSKRFDSHHFKLRYSNELGFSILSYGLSSTDGLGIPGFIQPHSECREVVNEIGVKEFFYHAEIEFLGSTISQEKFDFTGPAKIVKFLDKETYEKIQEILNKNQMGFRIEQLLVLNKCIKD